MPQWKMSLNSVRPLKPTRSQMTVLQTDMNQKTSDNERLKKEYDIYADQLKNRIDPMVKS